MKLKIAVLSVTVVALIAIPLSVEGVFCEPENPDYWCGYHCTAERTGCWSDSTVPQEDACVWTSYHPGACYTERDAGECSSSCEL